MNRFLGAITGLGAAIAVFMLLAFHVMLIGWSMAVGFSPATIVLGLLILWFVPAGAIWGGRR